MAEPTKVHIKRITTEDIKALYPLLETMGKVDNEQAVKLRARAMISDNSQLLGLAVLDEKAVGYVWVQSYGPHLRSGEITARLHDLFVLPEYRRQKVGQKLFEFAKEWAKNSNVKYLQWQASKEATSFYAKLGLIGDTKSDLEEHPFYEIKF